MKKTHVSERTVALEEAKKKIDTQDTEEALSLLAAALEVEGDGWVADLFDRIISMSEDLDGLHDITRCLDEITVHARQIRQALPEEAV